MKVPSGLIVGNIVDSETIVSAIFENFDYRNFTALQSDAKLCKLTLESFRVEDNKYLSFNLTGKYKDLLKFSEWMRRYTLFDIWKEEEPEE